MPEKRKKFQISVCLTLVSSGSTKHKTQHPMKLAQASASLHLLPGNCSGEVCPLRSLCKHGPMQQIKNQSAAPKSVNLLLHSNEWTYDTNIIITPSLTTKVIHRNLSVQSANHLMGENVYSRFPRSPKHEKSPSTSTTMAAPHGNVHQAVRPGRTCNPRK